MRCNSNNRGNIVFFTNLQSESLEVHCCTTRGINEKNRNTNELLPVTLMISLLLSFKKLLMFVFSFYAAVTRNLETSGYYLLRAAGLFISDRSK